MQLQRNLVQVLKRLVVKLAQRQLEQKAERTEPKLPRRLLLQKQQERSQLTLLLRQRAQQLQRPL